MNYIKRNLENVVSQVTKEYPVVLVTGPRQVGKTTMLQKLMEGTERGYVTLDDLNERNIAKTDPELFLQLHKPPVLIDEVQYAPELFTYIKMYVDKNHEPGAFWLIGSQVFKLMRGCKSPWQEGWLFYHLHLYHRRKYPVERWNHFQLKWRL